VRAAFAPPQASPREFWFVAEHAEQIIGVTRAMLVPVPPIYDRAAGTPGLSGNARSDLSDGTPLRARRVRWTGWAAL